MSEDIGAIESKIAEAVGRWAMLPPGCTVVAGLSGGADSVALVHYLRAASEARHIRLIAAHVNHGLRGEEADRDEAFVRSFCGGRGVELHVLHADVAAEAREKSLGIEECGRRVRYSFFRSLCGRGGRIATAHTLSDSAETVLMNLAKGSGAKGLCGIPPVRGNIVRPFIGITRAEVERYCSFYGLDFMTDSTNLTDGYGRNKLRLRAVPVLREINPEFERAVERTTKILRCDEEYFAGEAERLLCEAKGSGGYRLGVLQKAPRAVLLRAIGAAAERAGRARLNYGQICAAERVIREGRGAASVAGGVLFRAVGGVLRAGKPETAASSWSVPFSLEGTDLPDGRKLELRPVCAPPERKNPRKINNLLFNNLINYDTIMKTGGVVRSRRPGDAYRPAGRGVTKSLKKLFNEAKILPEERNGRAVLECGGKIVWTEDFGVSQEACASASSHAAAEIIVKECRQTVHNMQDDIQEVLFSQEKLARIVREMGARISRDYEGKNLLMVSILKGSVVFMTDLMRSITIPCSIDFMAVSSYGSGVKTSGVVKIIKDLDIDLKGWDVLVVEDILDSGLTLSYILEILQAREPKSIRLCTLFDKPDRRTADVRADYVGTVVPDEFIVGYGLDYAEKYRNLPYVGILKPEVYGG